MINNAEIKTYVKRLADLKTGEEGVIFFVEGSGPFRKRISEMGFIKGQKVTVVKNAPMKDPVEYNIMGYNVSLRRNEANLVQVVSPKFADRIATSSYEGVIEGNNNKVEHKIENGNEISVALVGNPNCGKTTLFNFASGAKERVGNYAGVTVDAKEATFKQDNYKINIADLPGTYSITEYSPEELFVRSYLLNEKPDIVINIIDASNLERNLFLTTQLIDMNVKTVIALNMYDELEQKGVEFDYMFLGKMIGIPIIPTIASKGKGINELFKKVIDVYKGEDENVREVDINYGKDIELAINKVCKILMEDKNLTSKYSSRFLAIKLIEGDKNTLSLVSNSPIFKSVVDETKTITDELESKYNDKSETLIADVKYGFIAGALKETYHIKKGDDRIKTTRDLDKVLTNKYWGFPIFIFFMWLTFQLTFTLGNYPMDWMDAGIGWIGDSISKWMPAGPLKDLIVDGIIGGVGGVIIFLPNIMILFFCISLMEDSGYMARGAFIMDKLMHKIGLHGKSFIPLIMGFGCNVPSVMATRTLDNKNDRWLTMLIVPFMSCSARLPVYALLTAAFFVKSQALVTFLMYISGIVIAILVGLLFKTVLFSKQEIPFVMELPPYRKPTLKNTTIHMWQKGSQYLRKMGTVILFASILIWALGYYPRKVDYSTNYDAQIEKVNNDNTITKDKKDELIANLELSKQEEHLEKSYIGKLGKTIEPAIRPLGFDWKIGVSILTGMAAKEIVVGSMGVLYHADSNADENSQTLKEKLQNQRYTSGSKIGQKVFSPLVALTLMLFVLIYFPCVAVIAAIKKESNWKVALFSAFYTTALAWIVSFCVYNIGNLF